MQCEDMALTIAAAAVARDAPSLLPLAPTSRLTGATSMITQRMHCFLVFPSPCPLLPRPVTENHSSGICLNPLDFPIPRPTRVHDICLQASRSVRPCQPAEKPQCTRQSPRSSPPRIPTLAPPRPGLTSWTRACWRARWTRKADPCTVSVMEAPRQLLVRTRS